MLPQYLILLVRSALLSICSSILAKRPREAVTRRMPAPLCFPNSFNGFFMSVAVCPSRSSKGFYVIYHLFEKTARC